LRLRELKARAFDARRGRRPRGNCGSLLSVCLARPGSLTAKPADSRAFHHHGVSMDSLHAIGFYVSSGVLLLGGLGVALMRGRELAAGPRHARHRGHRRARAGRSGRRRRRVANAGPRPVTPTLVAVFFVAGGVVAAGAFGAAWRRDASAAVASIPVMFAGVGVAFAGVARFAAAGG